MKSNKYRILIPGSHWLYYKLFSSTQISNKVLTLIWRRVIRKLIFEQKIRKWFFIRYNDPEDHLRIRFELSHTSYLGEIICLMYTVVNQLIQSGEMYNVQIDSYSRELERYGLVSIELSESLFFYNSEMVLHLIASPKVSNLEDWQVAMLMISNLLNSFGFSDAQKFRLLTSMSRTFGDEFGLKNDLKRILDLKYRKEKNIIFKVTSQNDNILKDKYFLGLVSKQQTTINQILAISMSKLKDDNELLNIVSQYIHMCCNRIFHYKQRQQEFVIYYLLSKHFSSSIARSKITTDELRIE